MLLNCFVLLRTEEEFKNGHVDVKNIVNVPYMFETPKGWFRFQFCCKPTLTFNLKYLCDSLVLVNVSYVDVTGRVKNPEFLEQVSSTFNKDDILIVV